MKILIRWCIALSLLLLAIYHPAHSMAVSPGVGVYGGPFKVTSYEAGTGAKSTMSMAGSLVIESDYTASIFINGFQYPGNVYIAGKEGSFIGRNGTYNLNARFKLKGTKGLSGTLTFLSPNSMQDARFTLKRTGP